MKLAAAAAALVACGIANAAPLVNGGFEAGDLTGWTKIQDYNGCASVVNTGAHEGTYSFKSLGCKSSISQTVAVTPGDYILSYWLKHSYVSGVPSFAAKINGVDVSSVTASTAFGWTDYQIPWTATESSATLLFDFRQTRNTSSWAVDQIAFERVPEVPVSLPGALGLALGGIALFGVARRMLPFAALSNPAN